MVCCTLLPVIAPINSLSSDQSKVFDSRAGDIVKKIILWGTKRVHHWIEEGLEYHVNVFKKFVTFFGDFLFPL